MAKIIESIKDLNEDFLAAAGDSGAETITEYLEMAVNGESKDYSVSDKFIPAVNDRAVTRSGRKVNALEHLMNEAGIKPRGRNASTFGELWDTPDRQILVTAFAVDSYKKGVEVEYARRGKAQNPDMYTTNDLPLGGSASELYTGGLQDQNFEPMNQLGMEDLVNQRTTISGDSFRSLVFPNMEELEDMESSRVAEGADIPRYKLELAEGAVEAHKHGARVTATYEVLRRQPLNLVEFTFAQIGRADVRRRIRAALAVALNGDGNGNPAIAIDAATAGAWGFPDFDALDIGMAAFGRSPALIVADAADVGEIRALRFAQANMVLTPEQLAMYGVGYLAPNGTPMRFAPPGSILEGSDTLLVRSAGSGLLEFTEAGSLIRESQRWIINQTVDFTMTENVGYSKPDPYAFFALEQGE